MWSLGHSRTTAFSCRSNYSNKVNRTSKTTRDYPIKIEAWTQFNDEKHYLKVISSARELISKMKTAKHSLAELELLLFDRR
jgi:hypothetical protein